MPITTTNMTLHVPIIGSDYDPTWESAVVYSFNAIDSHTHDGAGHGAKIPFNNLNFTTATPSLNSNPLTGATYYQLVQQATTLSVSPSGTGSLQVDTSGNLYYISTTTKVQLASISAIASGSTSGGFIGQYSASASAYYDTNTTGGITGGEGLIAPNTYYFMAVPNGTPGTSLYGNLAAQTLFLRGSPAYINFYDSYLNPNKYAWTFGMSATAQTGLEMAYTYTPSSTAYTALAFQLYETSSSIAVNNSTSNYPLKVFGVHFNENVRQGVDETFVAAGALTALQIGSGAGSQAEMGYFKVVYSSGGQAAVSQNFGGRFRYRLNTSSSGFADPYYMEWFWNNGTVTGSQYSGTARFNVNNNTSPYTALEIGATNTGPYVGIGQSVSNTYSSWFANPNFPQFSGATTTTSGGIFSLLNMWSSGNILPLVNAANNTSSPTGPTIGSSTYPWLSGYFVNLTVTGSVSFSGSISQSSFIPTSTGAPASGVGGLYKNNQVLAWGKVIANSGSPSLASGSYGLASVSLSSNTIFATYIVTLTNSISGPVAVIVNGADAGDSATGMNWACAQFTAGYNITVTTARSASGTTFSGSNNVDFYIAVIGSP